jgi:hypothetical protein
VEAADYERLQAEYERMNAAWSREVDENNRLRAALESIAANTCCDRCQEAALVARAALAGGAEPERTGYMCHVPGCRANHVSKRKVCTTVPPPEHPDDPGPWGAT